MTIETQTLQLDQIRIDGGTQPRVAIDQTIVAEYAELYSTGVDLPPVTVFFDGATYWLADGFHRYWANKRIDCEYVFAHVHQGTQRDALVGCWVSYARRGRFDSDSRLRLSATAWQARHERQRMTDTLDNSIRESATTPAKASGDSGSVEQHKLTDQIAADKYLESKKASRAKGLGIKLGKISPGGTV